MATLLLHLSAPLQSWGAESKFEVRRTMNFPTKSGVLGLVAAALGYSREDSDSLKKLNTLKFGIRIDHQGELLRDFHTAKTKKDAYVTKRFYLADAIFLAGLESQDIGFLNQIKNALKHPAFPLFLGRRSCPPTMPLFLGIRDTDLLASLRTEPWLLDESKQKQFRNTKLRIITDSDIPTEVIRDVPVSFSKLNRRFNFRNVTEEYINADTVATVTAENIVATAHDPFA
ncbi:MAG: type I-E CRISPR-associated protein Cas5/CasD [Oscillospiraceae bacterium]|nr:type I-E CRISPR-associated protein Cas5/CasD [Oscillospiraceae bacterium]